MITVGQMEEQRAREIETLQRWLGLAYSDPLALATEIELILRSVGATRPQILGVFLAEGAFIGLVGSLLGLALARGLAIPADNWVRGILQKQMEEDKLLTPSVFIFPWWLWAGSVAFAVVVTTVAAYYPARRAARIHPIEALRYG